MRTIKMNTYVNFPGTCAKAFCYYEKHLGAKPGMMMTHGQLPDQSRVSPEWKDAVLHARISLADTELMDADIPSAQPMRSAHLTLSVDSDAEAERIFSALSEGGDVLMPMEKTFFASLWPGFAEGSVFGDHRVCCLHSAAAFHRSLG